MKILAHGVIGFVALVSVVGCDKLRSHASDGDGGTTSTSATTTGTTGTTGTSATATNSKSKSKVCDLVTDAEMEAAVGKKLLNKSPGSDQCSWTFKGAAQDGSGGSVNVQIVDPSTIAAIPNFSGSTPKSVADLGTKAEWVGGITPMMKIWLKDGKVMTIMIADPQAMMGNFGMTQKDMGKGNTKVEMALPLVEKEAIAIGKAGVGRY